MPEASRPRPDEVMEVPEVRVVRADLLSLDGQRLVSAMRAEISGRYPEEDGEEAPLTPEEVAEGHGAFMLAYIDGRAAGCGAVRLIGPSLAEVKRMFVTLEDRGRRVGAAILAALESEALALGAARLVLETGVRQPEAQALYRRAGFAVIPPYNAHVAHPLSVCMAKDLR